MKETILAMLLLFLSVDAFPQDTLLRNTVLSISVPHVASYAGERIVSFEIEVTAGMVQTVSNLPKGWYVIVDNDASWCTKVKGNTLVGAAALSPEEFQNIRLMVEKDETHLKFSISGAVSVTKDFEKERHVQLRNSDFTVSSTRYLLRDRHITHSPGWELGTRFARL